MVEPAQSMDVAERLDTVEPIHRHTIARMFENDLIEFFSKVHPIIPALIYVPVVLWMGAASLTDFGVPALALSFVFGLLFWTLTEYTLHRFLFHIEPRGPVSRLIYFNLHGVHHQYPDDYFRLVMVPVVSLPLAFFFYWLFGQMLPPSGVSGAFAGMVLGYLLYDYSHFATHFVRPPKAAWLDPVAQVMMAQRKRHMKHHFGDHDRGFGVSTGFWDHVFGTVDGRRGGE